jgi:hypothetical protein
MDTRIVYFLTKSEFLCGIDLTKHFNGDGGRFVYRVPGGFRAHYESTDCTGQPWAERTETIFGFDNLEGKYVACAQGVGTNGACSGSFAYWAQGSAIGITPRSYRSTSGTCVAENPAASAYYPMKDLGPDGTGDVPAPALLNPYFCVAR